jgi:hypothetical protein
VLAGRSTYNTVLADPENLRRTWRVYDGEFLLQAAPETYEQATGLAWDHETRYDYETGSSGSAWPPTAPIDHELDFVLLEKEWLTVLPV